ncbi:MAG: HAD family hydrolase [Clostridiaceae bacterium]
MINNIVFDIGNVLLDFKPQEYLKNKGFSDALIDKLMTCIFMSREWIELDKGTIEVEEAVKNFIDSAPTIGNEIIEIMEDWTSMLKPKEDMIEMLYKLKKKGYRIYLLSNYHKKAFAFTRRQNRFIEDVDGYVISWEHNCIKPQKEIYFKLLDKYSLINEETLFIDDMEENVIGAEQVGIKGIIFSDVENLKKTLKKYDIDI